MKFINVKNLTKSKICLPSSIFNLKFQPRHEDYPLLQQQHQRVNYSTTPTKIPRLLETPSDVNNNHENRESLLAKLNAEKKGSLKKISYASKKSVISTIPKAVVQDFVQYVEQISHMDDVRDAQNKVMDIKDKLKLVGDRKREILFELNLIRNDIQKNHNEICNSTRGTERYITLVRDEMSLLKSEQSKTMDFSQADELERQMFNQLTTAINDSYEREKVHTNFIKVLGLIGTLVASIVTLAASVIGHFYHNTKFGLVAADFKDSVNKTIHSEISILNENLRRQENLMKQLIQENKGRKKDEIKESWGGYFKRHSVNSYRYFFPKTKQV